MDEIRTDRLRLRPYTASDRDAVVAGLNQIAVSRWLAKIPHPFTHDDLKLVGEDGASRWPKLAAIEHEGAVIGGIGGGETLGYWLVPEAHGRGLGFEAAWSMVDYSFRHLAIERIASGVFEGNPASARILEKLGFAETGKGEEMCTALGRELPHTTYALTRDAWEARQ